MLDNNIDGTEETTSFAHFTIELNCHFEEIYIAIYICSLNCNHNIQFSNPN